MKLAMAVRIDRSRNIRIGLVLVVGASLAPSSLAWAQNSPDLPAAPPQQAAPETPPAPADPAPALKDNPGLINELGKMFTMPTMPTLTLPSLPALKSPAETIDDLNARAKDATDGLPRLTTMVKGRTTCPISANGAPDCKLASDRLCQSKGFKEGKSLDTDSARSCSAKSLLAGGKPAEGECRTENYVTRALCQ